MMAHFSHMSQAAFHFGYARYRERVDLPLLKTVNNGGSCVRLRQAQVLAKSDPSVDDLAQNTVQTHTKHMTVKILMYDLESGHACNN